MTEAEWLEATDPQVMLDGLRERSGASPRRWRLAACACVRRVWRLLGDPRSQAAVEVAERFADALAGEGERAEAETSARAASVPSGGEPWFAALAAKMTVAKQVPFLLQAVLQYTPVAGFPISREKAKARDVEQAHLLRDVFGNPFRPLPPLAPAVLAWNDGLVIRLAQPAYDDRQTPSGYFDRHRLAVLADALEDAGCPADTELIKHLRGQGPHWRGCWGVDAVLGKE